jgi:hypothetical protein
MTTPPAPEPAPAGAAARPRHVGRRLLLWLVVLPLFLVALYTWLTINWSYSNGYRSGLLQKFSEKGWVCKTHEGELWQSVVNNVSPTIWEFSVRNDRVARTLDSLVGKPVRVHYTEHRGVPTTCFADTRYFVDSVFVVPPQQQE